MYFFFFLSVDFSLESEISQNELFCLLKQQFLCGGLAGTRVAREGCLKQFRNAAAPALSSL